MALVIKGSSSGQVTVDVPASAGTNTLTLPTNTATVGIVGPSFRAYQSSAQTLANGTFTKISFDTEVFDTASCYDNTSNYRFTPNVAGYYYIKGMVRFAGTSDGKVLVARIYKNGSNDTGTIVLQDDSNGQGPYIKEWNHPSETQPTEEELA
jgi:hypothetical protein